MISKLRQMVSRFHMWGVRATVFHYVRSVAARLSLNYRLNPEHEREQRGMTLPFFVCYDAFLGYVDYLLRGIEHFITYRTEIGLPLTGLALYQVQLESLSEKSVVYSFGVSNNVAFDQALAERCGCKVYLFDPTPPAVKFIETQIIINPSFVFNPIGIWVKTAVQRFYVDRSLGQGNFSIVNFFNTKDFFEARCMTLEDIMQEQKHNHIDVLKLDIEGAALPVLERLLNGYVRPTQILAELEMPMLVYGASLGSVFSFIKRKRKLFSGLKKAGYSLTTYSKAEFTALRV